MSYQPTKISRQKVRLSTIPIDVLYNSHTNQIKATALSGITTSYVPIHFKLEHESFAKHGRFEVTYTTQINGVDIEATHRVSKVAKHKGANEKFADKLKASKPSRRESISNPFPPRVFDHLLRSSTQTQSHALTTT